jgi:hypothetical protein
MSKKDLMDYMQRLTKQLKGAPLKEFEKKQLRQGFEQATGSAFNRAKSAITEVLHSKPSYLYEKAEVLADVKRLINDLGEAAKSYENGL